MGLVSPCSFALCIRYRSSVDFMDFKYYISAMKNFRGSFNFVLVLLTLTAQNVSAGKTGSSEPKGESNQKKPDLIKAASRGRVSAVRELLAGGSHVDVRDEWGHTALMYAAMGGYTETALALLEAGAD